MKKKSIIFVTTTFEESQNGPSIFAQYLWDAFKDRVEFDFHMIAPTSSVAHPKFHHLETSSDSGIYRRIQVAALDLAEKLGGDVVYHGNISHATDVLSRSGRKCIVQINDYESADAIQDFVPNSRYFGLRRSSSLVWRHFREKTAVQSANYIVCNSEYTQDRIHHAYGVKAHDSMVIHKAVSVDHFTLPKDLPPNPGPSRKPGARLVYVGANWKLKGLSEILWALPSILKWNPGATLAVIGPSSASDLAGIRSLATKLKVAESVNIVGRVGRSELPKWYWHSDLLVAPTAKEAFGVSLLEAMAAGLPVLANPVGQIPKLLEDGRCGFLRGYGSPLADQIVDALKSNMLSTIIQNAEDRANQFSDTKMLSQYISLYSSI